MISDSRLDALASATPLIWVHFLAVMAALVLGALVLWRGKGDARHRWRGRVWVGLMAFGALTSFGIREINPGGFSAIHILSAYVLLALGVAVWGARRGTVAGLRWHRKTMQTTYAAGLIIAGGANFLPGRLVGRVVFGEGASVWHYGAAIASLLLGLWLIYRTFRPGQDMRLTLRALEAERKD